MPAAAFRPYVLPPPDLQPYIDRIWGWESEQACAVPTLLPGTGAEWILQYRDSFRICDSDGAVRRPPEAFIFCLRSRAVRLQAEGPIGMVAVRFRGSALRHFGRLGLPELQDQLTPAQATFGPAVDDLLEVLRGPADFSERAARLIDFLRLQRARHQRNDGQADKLLEALYYEDATRPLGELVSDLGLSVRQVERTVGAAAGVTPKRFRRIARFHHTMRALYLRGASDYLDEALARGYYDQSHFVHECRELTGHSPGQLLSPAQLMSHFYNTSRRG